MDVLLLLLLLLLTAEYLSAECNSVSMGNKGFEFKDGILRASLWLPSPCPYCVVEGSGRPVFPQLCVLAAGLRISPVPNATAWNRKRGKVQEVRS